MTIVQRSVGLLRRCALLPMNNTGAPEPAEAGTPTGAELESRLQAAVSEGTFRARPGGRLSPEGLQADQDQSDGLGMSGSPEFQGLLALTRSGQLDLHATDR